MFLLVFIAISLGFLLIFLLTTISPNKKQIAIPSTKNKVFDNVWTRNEFEEHCIDVIEGWGLKILKTSQEEGEIMEIFAENPKPFVGGQYIIHSLYNPPDGVVNQSDIIALSTVVRYEGETKGFFITNGIFPENAEELISESPIDLIDGEKLEELINQ